MHRTTNAPLSLTVVLLALIALGIGPAFAYPQNEAQTATISTLPPEVRAALERAPRMYPEPLRGARWSKAAVLSGTEHTLYQVQGTNGRGNKIELEATKAGRIIEVEEHGVPLSEVPDIVLAALRSVKPDFEPTLVEAIYQTQRARPVCYGFEGPDVSGKTIEVYISADGKTLLNEVSQAR